MAESAGMSSETDTGKEPLDVGTLKEYEPLTDLLSHIPKKVNTCVTVCLSKQM